MNVQPQRYHEGHHARDVEGELHATGLIDKSQFQPPMSSFKHPSARGIVTYMGSVGAASVGLSSIMQEQASLGLVNNASDFAKYSDRGVQGENEAVAYSAIHSSASSTYPLRTRGA